MLGKGSSKRIPHKNLACRILLKCLNEKGFKNDKKCKEFGSELKVMAKQRCSEYKRILPLIGPILWMAKTFLILIAFEKMNRAW